MRILFIHADRMEYEAQEKALRSAPDLPKDQRRASFGDVLVCFTSAEKRDEGTLEATVAKAADEVEAVAQQIKERSILIYPYAHLSPSLAEPSKAEALLQSLHGELRRRGYEAHLSPFGWYKSFTIACKGHALSELSKEIVAEEKGGKDEVSKALKAEAKLVSHWFIMDLEGKLHTIEGKEGKVHGFNFQGHENLRKFASYEIAKSREVKEEPPHIRYMRELELVDYEPGSDPGNLRYYPKGRLVKGLLEELVNRRVWDYGGMQVETPIMYDYEHPALKAYLDRFPARQYTIQTPDKRVFLRFAADFGQFLMAHDMVLSYKELPVKLYELTRYSFRVEQRGELAGLRRLRAFTMPDCHAFCADLAMVKEEFFKRFDLAWNLQRDVGFDMPGDFELGLRITKEFWEDHGDLPLALVKRWGKPILMEVWDRQFFYYTMKYEWNFVDNNDKAAALTTDQVDTESAARYGIKYIDEKGEARHPLIMHLSPSGAIERQIYALLEKAHRASLQGKPPMLPVWLSPVQVRVIPVAEGQLSRCEAVVEELQGIRVDLDDTSDTLGKKIRRAEKEWIPYIAVVGQKEVESGRVSVRVRATRKQEEMAVADLSVLVTKETAGLPFRPLPVPMRLSRRPSFR